MRRITAFLLIAGLFFTGLTTFPSAAAFHSWTETTINEQNVTNGAVNDVIVAPRIIVEGSTTHYVYTTDDPGFDLMHRSKTGGVLSSEHTVSTAAVDGFKFKATGSTLILCYVDLGDVFFVTSTNNGATWSTPVTVEATNVLGNDCEITFFGSTYGIFYSNDTNDLTVLERSIDGGATWSAAIVVGTHYVTNTAVHTNYNNIDSEVVVYAAINSTAGTLFYQEATGATDQLRMCSTTDSGVTWAACVNINGAIVNGFDAQYVSGTRFDVAIIDSGGLTIRHCTGTSGTGLWTCSAAGTAASAASFIRMEIDSDDSTRIGIVWNSLTNPPVVRYTQTSDLGESWTTVETVATTTGTFTIHVDSAILPNGRFDVLFYRCIAVGGAEAACNGTVDLLRTVESTATFADAGSLLAPTATVATTNLQGYDVDPLGGTVVIRDDSDIETYTATTLASSGTFATTCNQLDGVMANRDGNLVAFIDCDVGGDPTHLKIRTAALQDPTQSDFSGCAVSGTFICNKDIALDGFSEAGGDGSGKLPSIRDFPINYSSTSPENGLDRRRIAWGYASISGDAAAVGRVGVNAYTNVESGSDLRNFAETQYAPTNVEDFCIGLDGSQYYMTAAGADTTTKVYPVTFSTGVVLTPTLGSPTVYAAALSQARGIACGESRVLIQNNDHVWITDRDGTVQKDVTAVSTENRGVVISEQFTIGANATVRQFGAYLSDGIISVIDVGLCVSSDDCEALATIAQPAGTWRGMVIDRTAQSLWVFTSTLVSLYDIHSDTTVTPVSPQTGAVPPVPTPTTTLLPAQDPGNVVGLVVTNASEQLGFDVASLFALVIILAITIKASHASGGAVIVVALAAFIGTIIVVQLGLLSEWVIYAVVFLLIVTAGGVIFASRRSGAGGET